MTRKNGFYWIKTKTEDYWQVANWHINEWFNCYGCSYKDSELVEIDETPITRPQTSKIINTNQTLATLKETLSDFPDSLIVSKVFIEMHNKFSIQITEYNAE
jgi:hypothetical protein